MQLNGQKLSRLSEKLSFNAQFIGVKNAKSAFLKNNGEVFLSNKVQLVINWYS